MHTILINSSEITLKGKNRGYFEQALKENIARGMQKNNVLLQHIQKDGANIICVVEGEKEAVQKSLNSIFGINQYFFVEETESNFSCIKEYVRKKMTEYKENNVRTINLKTRRSNKDFPIKSPEINKHFGEIAAQLGVKVNYRNEENILYTIIGKKKTYFSQNKYSGLGGLPVGTSGKVLVLLSGGIDSPAAATMLMKRGVRCDFFHLHNLKENADVLHSKIKTTLEVLNTYQFESKLYTVPYTFFDLAVMGSVPQRYELVLFKHYLLKLAETIAKKEKYLAIATGDSIAQVASQTLENVHAAEYNISVPVFHPLIGFNKEEIIAVAEKMGTYNISIEAYKDCCSLVSKHPATRTPREKIRTLVEEVDMDTLLKKSITYVTVYKIT